MGEVYARKVLGLRRTSVGLLANGEEDSKGNALTKEAFKLMKGSVSVLRGMLRVVISLMALLMLLCVMDLPGTYYS